MLFPELITEVAEEWRLLPPSNELHMCRQAGQHGSDRWAATNNSYDVQELLDRDGWKTINKPTAVS